MAAPKPKPTALKLLSGNPGKRKLPENEPKPKVVAPRPPTSLSSESKKVWRKLVKPLAAVGIMTELDIMMLAALCDIEVRYQLAQDQISGSDQCTQMTPNGMEIQSVWIGIANKCLDQKIKILTEFGMSPSSRTKIQVATPDELDPLEDIRRGRKPK